MIESRKVKILLTAMYKNGTIIIQDCPTPAKAYVQDIPGSKFKELAIRMVVDSKNAESLLEGLANGTTTLNIEQIPFE